MAMRLDHGTDELEEVHGINVTPFIDVMLVLLIIFMVAAPLATVGATKFVRMGLPKSDLRCASDRRPLLPSAPHAEHTKLYNVCKPGLRTS
jgi:biopolymer transport protein ExbD